MGKTVQNVAKVSLFFFLALGALHLSSALLMAQGVMEPVNLMFFRFLDLPFLFAALVYGVCRLSLTVEEITGNLKTPLLALSFISGILFIGSLYLNFAFPDASLL